MTAANIASNEFGFDLDQLALADEAETGVWFVFRDGIMELKVSSSSTKKYKRSAMKSMKKASQKARGKKLEDLPIEKLEALTDSLLADNVLRGWSTLIPKSVAEGKNLEYREVYHSDGEPTPEGKVLVDFAILDGELLEISNANIRTVFDRTPMIRDEVANLAGDEDAFLKGGADALD